MSELILPTRRKFIIGLTGLFCAPAIIRVSSLMPVRALSLSVGVWEAWAEKESPWTITIKYMVVKTYGVPNEPQAQEAEASGEPAP